MSIVFLCVDGGPQQASHDKLALFILMKNMYLPKNDLIKLN